MKPKSFHDLAARLANEGSEPAQFRTAISRAYYSVYNTGAHLVRTLTGAFEPPENQGYHTWLRDCLKQSKDNLVIQTGQQLYGMSEQRKDADYEMDASKAKTAVENQKTAQTAVELAARLIERLENARKDPTRRNRIQTALHNCTRARRR